MRGGYQIYNFAMGEFHPKKGYFFGPPECRPSVGAHTHGAYPYVCSSYHQWHVYRCLESWSSSHHGGRGRSWGLCHKEKFFWSHFSYLVLAK
jgi:hypothetical protein